MPTLATSEFPPPKSDKEFELIVRDIFAAYWHDSDTKTFGRNGQKQCGVDIYGRPNQEEAWFGIQCKLRTTTKLSRKELEQEIELAKNFHHKLHTYIFATTHARDTKLQKIVEELNQMELEKDGFNIQIKFWDDICSLLAENIHIARKHYPQFFKGGSHSEHSSYQPLAEPLNDITEKPHILMGNELESSYKIILTYDKIGNLLLSDIELEAISHEIIYMTKNKIGFNFSLKFNKLDIILKALDKLNNIDLTPQKRIERIELQTQLNVLQNKNKDLTQALNVILSEPLFIYCGSPVWLISIIRGLGEMILTTPEAKYPEFISLDLYFSDNPQIYTIINVWPKSDEEYARYYRLIGEGWGLYDLPSYVMFQFAIPAIVLEYVLLTKTKDKTDLKDVLNLKKWRVGLR